MQSDNTKRSLKVCMSIRPELNAKIVELQTKQMKKTGEKYSFSKAVSDILEEYFRK